MKVVLVEPNIGYSPLPNLGLAYLISSIEARHPVSLLDLTFEWKNYEKSFKSCLLSKKPDVLGFSVSSYTYFTGLKLANLAKQLLPGVHIIFGGVQPTISPEEVIRHPAIDSICIGEGEHCFSDFLNMVKEGLEPKIDGFWYKDKKGEIVRTPLRPFVSDLDALPFVNWDRWDIIKYLKTNFVHTGIGGLLHLSSRGCPNNCNFCSVHVIRRAVPGKYYRVRSAEKVIEEIKWNMKKYWDIGFRGVNLHDGLFGADWEQFEQFCTLYKKEGLHKMLPWSCMTRPEIVSDRWARLAASAGCVKVNIGIETADQTLRNLVYRKPTTNAQIEQAIACLEKFDIYYLFLMMIGCPEESRETIRENIRFIKRYSPIDVRMPFCQPMPQTDYSKISGKIFDDTDKELFFLKGDDVCRVRSKYLSINQLNNKIMRFRIWWLFRWLVQDITGFGFRFIIDIAKYVFNIGKVRLLDLRHPYTYKVIKAITHLNYHFASWKKRHGIRYRYRTGGGG